MIFTESPLPGAFTIEIERLPDERGFFARYFCAREFAARGLAAAMPECSMSFNPLKGTLRGMHYQEAPHAEDKLVRCTAGAIFDAIVDVRQGSPTRHRCFTVELSADNHRALYVPQGFAHGFLTLTQNTEVEYMISVPYAAGFGRGIRWNDPTVGIPWPSVPALISDRDAEYPLLGASTIA